MFFISQHFPYKNWILYVLKKKKKKKKKKRKRLRHSLRSTLNYHYDCLIWTLKKRLVSNYYCFSVRNISHTKIGFYTYLKKKKKKKKKRKRLRHSLRSTLNYHYDCLIWTLKKRLVSNYYCFSVRNISHTIIGFYTYLKKKKKKKKKAKKIKTQFKVYLKLSLWLFNLNFEKEISQ